MVCRQLTGIDICVVGLAVFLFTVEIAGLLGQLEGRVEEVAHLGRAGEERNEGEESESRQQRAGNRETGEKRKRVEEEEEGVSLDFGKYSGSCFGVRRRDVMGGEKIYGG